MGGSIHTQLVPYHYLKPRHSQTLLGHFHVPIITHPNVNETHCCRSKRAPNRALMFASNEKVLEVIKHLELLQGPSLILWKEECPMHGALLEILDRDQSNQRDGEEFNRDHPQTCSALWKEHHYVYPVQGSTYVHQGQASTEHGQLGTMSPLRGAAS